MVEDQWLGWSGKRVKFDRLACLFLSCFISAGHLAARGILKKNETKFLVGERKVPTTHDLSACTYRPTGS